MKNPFHPNCLPFIDVWSNHLGVGGILLLVRFENQTHQKRKAKIALISESVKRCRLHPVCQVALCESLYLPSYNALVVQTQGALLNNLTSVKKW